MCIYVCVYIYTHRFIYVHIWQCIHVAVGGDSETRKSCARGLTYVCVRMCVCVYIFINTWIYICTYIYKYTYIDTWNMYIWSSCSCLFVFYSRLFSLSLSPSFSLSLVNSREGHCCPESHLLGVSHMTHLFMSLSLSLHLSPSFPLPLPLPLPPSLSLSFSPARGHIY